MKSVKYIYRIDSYCGHGWQVRLCDGQISKMFSDAKHGGKRKAMAAAKKYLKQAVNELPTRKRKRHKHLQKNGRSTSKGISKRFGEGKNEDKQTAWVGFYWWPGRGIQQKYFSIRKCGSWEAKRLALEFRKDGLAKMAKMTKYR